MYRKLLAVCYAHMNRLPIDMTKTELTTKLREKSATIGVVGLGYVGLPLLLTYTHAGYRTIGFDIEPEKTLAFSDGRSYIRHIPDATIQAAVKQGAQATTDFQQIAQVDALILCIPTPLNKHREPDLTFVLNTIEQIKPYLHAGQVVSLESTTYPGTTDEELKPRIQATGLSVGKDIFVVYSPEREDPGNTGFSTRTIPKICGGCTPNCLEVGIALYDSIIDQVVPVSSTRTAELTKLLENIHRAVNIGLVNEMKVVADKMNIDIHEVIRAAATKPFGFVPYYPSPGLGGHCIPIDPFYLTWKAREYGVHTRFIELAGEVNSSMPSYVVAKTVAALNAVEKAVNGSHILILGLAYKKNVDDMRESPAVRIMEQLAEMGAKVAYSDPFIPVFPKVREHQFHLNSVELTSEVLGTFDCILIATDHDTFDYELIQAHARLIIDSRGRYTDLMDHIIKA